MPFSKTEATFGVNVTGESSGRQYPGTFKVKLVLSHRERLRIDQLRREFLGPSPDGQAVDPELAVTAQVLAELGVRVLEGPKWWESSNGGADLEDAKPLTEVYNRTMEEVLRAQGLLKDEGEKATNELKKDAQANSEG